VAFGEPLSAAAVEEPWPLDDRSRGHASAAMTMITIDACAYILPPRNRLSTDPRPSECERLVHTLGRAHAATMPS